MTANPLSFPTPAAIPIAAVYPSFTLQAALGGSFRGTLINESFNVATWPVADWIYPGAIMHDIGPHGFHGRWFGSGVTPAVPFDIVPEGLLGANMTGFGWGEVPSEPSPDPNFNLSLAGGDVDVSCIVQHVVADGGPERAIVAKQDGNSLGNGYHLCTNGLGHVKFYAAAGGVQVVQMEALQNLADGHVHVITAHYLPSAHRARIYIDGVMVIENTTGGVELPITSGPLRVGLFSGDATADGSGFKGTIGYVSIGREGDESLNARLMATLVWTDITADVRTGPNPIQLRMGIPGNGPGDRVATTGTLAFALDNGKPIPGSHPYGYYTPGHSNVRTGWRLGVPILWTLHYSGVPYPTFHGRLAEVRPEPGVRGTRHVDCTVTDWMDVAAGSPLSAMQPQINKTSAQVLQAAIAQSAGRTPMSLDFHPSTGFYPYAGDTGEGEADSMLTEIGRIAMSEDGFIYIRNAGQLTFEGHGERVWKAVAAVFSETMSGLEVLYSLQQFINIVRVTYTPRRVSPSNTAVLYALDISTQPQLIKAGETRIIEGGYVDPANEAERVGAAELQPFTAGVDYLFTRNADGSGGDLTANLDVSSNLGGNSFRVTLSNPSSVDGYLHLTSTVGIQIRGRAIYHYKPVLEERRDGASVRERGPRTLAIELPYQTNPQMAAQIATDALALYNREDALPSSITIQGNRNSQLMGNVMFLQPGDKIGIGEGMTGVTPVQGFVIQEKQLTYQGGHLITATYSLARATPFSTAIPARLGIMRLGTSRLNFLGGVTRTGT
jgi:hypothetical protein